MKRLNNKGEVGVVGAVVFTIIVLLTIVICAICLEKVPAGYVAVQYNANGGIQDEILTQGWHFTSPMVKTTEYTVGIEQSYLCKDDKGDSADNESFSASSKEGKALQIDLTFTYQFQQDKVTEVFTKFKGQSGEEVRDKFIKPNIISWTKEVVARYAVSDILGEKRSEVNQELTKYLANKFNEYGISISNVSLINIEVDSDTQKAINAKIAAQQNAETQAIQNKTNVEKAEADAKVKTTTAKADADAKKIAADAEAEANKKVAGSITKELIDYETAQARKQHGWVTVNGAGTVVTKD